MRVRREDIPMYITGAAAVLTVVSIATFEVLMGLAVVALIVTRQGFRSLPILVPLALFFTLTVISLQTHSNWPLAYPQVKKFYVYLMPFLMVSAFREGRRLIWVAWGWGLAASVSA